MSRRRWRRSNSIYGNYTQPKKKEGDFLQKKFHLFGKQLTIGFSIGFPLSIIIIIFQCIAFFTPHWKEISPNTHSLYVDGVDALIRTEVLIYFNSIHRFTRHSYGLFQRCEYPLNNTIKYFHKQDNNNISHQYKKCTKNFLPSFNDDKFNECHSLQYYRFCSKTSTKNFNINNDYLLATFDISSNRHINIDSTLSCNCSYPTYINACHILGIFSIIFLILTSILYGVFPLLNTRHQRLKIKCFAVLSSILSIIFILCNLLIVLNHLYYESIEYLVAIERHYRLIQIYKLSEDTNIVIKKFLSSIKFEIGYSTIISWIAFILSIIDGILLMISCRISNHLQKATSSYSFSAIPSETYDNENNPNPTIPLTTISNITNFDPIFPPPPRSPLPTIVIDEDNEQSNTQSSFPVSCLKRPSLVRTYREDEV